MTDEQIIETPRSYSVVPVPNWIPGWPKTMWELRYTGQGIGGYVATDSLTGRAKYISRELAERAGAKWVEEAIYPAFQTEKAA